MHRYFIIYSFLFFACISALPAQEVVTGLQSNPLVGKAAKEKAMKKSSSSQTSLSLPFFDDFSGKSILPDSKKWTDNYVFINNTYSDQQITQGVATFDALGNTGRLYETATIYSLSALITLPLSH